MYFVSEILCVQIDFSGTTKPFFLIPSNMSFKITSNILALIMAPFKISEIQTRYSFIILCELFQKSDLCIYNTQDPNSFLVMSMAQTDEFNLIQII